MTSLQFSGSPWWLLLLIPGLLILARQYRGGGGARNAALLALQAAALILLTVSLTAPEWVRRKAEFHNPVVLLLTDRSGSFDGGAYLGLGEAYAEASGAVAAAYRARGFDVAKAEFHEAAWAVEGLRGKGGRRGPPEGAPAPALTSLAAAADFLDSAGPPNLRAVFLFGDGRAPLDSGKAGRPWPAPVHPVILRPEGISEAQIGRAALEAGERGQGNLDVTWVPVGAPRGGPRLEVFRGGKPVFAAVLPAGEGDGPRTARIPWKAGLPLPVPGEAEWRAALIPAGDKANRNPFNDTVSLEGAGPGGRGRRLLLAKPLRSLDEKGMVDLLHARGDFDVEMSVPEALAAAGLTARDQIWVEASLASGRPALLRTLRETPASVVLYARPGALPAELAGARIRPLAFSSGAEVRPSRAASEAFPDGVVRLKAVAAGPLDAPAAEAPFREAAVLIEGGRKGLLMAWLPLAPGKDALFLALPPLWRLLFDPQADFAARENLDGLLRAASSLAGRQEGAVRALLPARAHDGLPFDLEFTLPAAGTGEGGSLELKARAVGIAAEKDWTLAGPGPETYRLEGATLAAGRWALELLRGGRRIWGDTLEVASRASLEFSRIGFDAAALEDLALRTGGRVIEAAAGGAAGEAAEVTSQLPRIEGAQVKSERTEITRLHNTRWQFLLAAALLSLSWFLRKRWDLD